MLDKLLQAIQSGRTLQPAELAVRLQTSPAMVQMMLEDLERMGKLARVETTCDTSCGSCPVADMCMPKGNDKYKIWSIK